VVRGGNREQGKLGELGKHWYIFPDFITMVFLSDYLCMLEHTQPLQMVVLDIEFISIDR